MEKLRQYEIEGLVLCVPLRYDAHSRIYLEDYREYIEHSHVTPGGYPVMFAGEDACGLGREREPGGCPDCGSCRFFMRADAHTWLGICKHEEKKRAGYATPNEGGQSI